MRLIGYERVSTSAQGESGLGLEAQRSAVDAYAALGGHEVEHVIEVASGGKIARPVLREALRRLAAGEADGLAVAKLDRLSRSVGDFAGLVETAKRQGWALIVVDLGLDLSTPMGEAMAGMVSVFAQLERRMIGERTRVALEAARERGVVLGRPAEIDEGLAGRIRELRAEGLTMRAIAEQLNDAGVPTVRGGGQWWPSTVRVVLQRS